MTLGDWYVSPAHNAPHQEPWQMLQDLRQRSALQTDFGVEFTCYSWPISIIFKIHYLVLTIMINLVTDEITSELAVSVGKHPTYSELKSPGHFSSYHETIWLFFSIPILCFKQIIAQKHSDFPYTWKCMLYTCLFNFKHYNFSYYVVGCAFILLYWTITGRL